MSLKMINRFYPVGQTIMYSNLYMARQFSSTIWNCRKTHTTVDNAEIALHTDQWKVWWNPNGPMKALHAMNMLRVPFIRDGLVNTTKMERFPRPLAGIKILDVGCGGGILSEALSRLGANVTGIDASKKLIELAQSHCSGDPSLAHNLPTYCHSTIEDFSQHNANVYDGVVASEIIEHVADKELFMSSCITTLKPCGKIFITTPSRTRVTQIFGIFFAEYILRNLPIGTHHYNKLCTPNEVASLLRKNNCHIEVSYGMIYNFLTNKWHWIEKQTFLFAMQAVKLN